MNRSSIPLRPSGVTSFGAVAVAPHHLATQAAMAVFAVGGNAVDAAVAANAAQGVVAPETCGIGGDLFALVYEPGDSTPHALNSSGRAGSAAAQLAAELRSTGVDQIPQRHPAAVTVPGCVDGWLTLHERLGRVEFGTVLEPAIRLARDGFPANREMAAAFAARADEMRGEPAASPMYAQGRPPLEGERIARPQLATTLEAIAEGGRDAFYAGTVGQAITTAVGGAIDDGDLGRVQAEWVDPLRADLFGVSGWTIPPNSQGYIGLLALAIMEHVGSTETDAGEAWHLAVEAYRLAAADRDRILADADNMGEDPSALLSRDRIEQLADRYSPTRPSEPGHVPRATGGTAYMCTVDADGMGVSLIQSNFYGIGAGISVAEGGFLLHDRGRGFTLEPGHPNELAAGRRPLHTLSPTIWTDEHGLAAIIGTRGGYVQPQLVSQLGARILGDGMEPDVAMAFPRWTIPVPAPSDGSHIEVEPGTPEPVIDGLTERGHTVHRHDVPQSGWGPMSAVTVTRPGLRRAAADPRVDTATAAAN